MFEGVSLFPEQELRHALACDLKYQTAVRPSAKPLDLLLMLERRLHDGYQHCGCPDASVNANFDTKRGAIIVHVEEGPRYRRGKIEIVGLEKIDNDAIIQWLTTPQRPPSWTYLVNDQPLDAWAHKEISSNRGRYGEETNNSSDGEKAERKTPEATAASRDADPITFWQPDEVVDFGNLDLSKLTDGVRLALLQLGYANANFHIDLIRDAAAGVVRLQITLPEGLTRSTIGGIETIGLSRDSREALLKYLQVARDDSIDAKQLQKVMDRLADSCRYWTYSIAVNMRQGTESDAANSKPTLRLTLEEYAAAPPLNEPLSPTQQVMHKCATWIESLNSKFGDRDLVCTTEAVEIGGGSEQSQVALAADGTLAIRGNLTTTIGIRADHTLIMGPRGIEIYDWKGKDKFWGSPEAVPCFNLKIGCEHQQGGIQCANASFRYDLKSFDKESAMNHSCVAITAEPAAMLHLADNPGMITKLSDGILTVKSESIEIRVDEKTGAIQSIKSASFLPAGIATIDFKTEKGFVAKLAAASHQKAEAFSNCYNEADPWGSTLVFLSRQFQRQPAVQKSPALTSICRQAIALVHNPLIRERLVRLAADNDQQNPSKTGRFWIPGEIKGETTLGMYRALYFYLPYVADEVFPRESWPWTVCREAAFSEFAEAGGADEDKTKWLERMKLEYLRIYTNPDYGPCGSIIFAQVLKRYLRGGDAAAVFTATRGLNDLSDEAFLKDVHLLTKGEHGLAVACRAIAEQCGGLSNEDQEELQMYMPAEAHDVLKSLVARRNAKPDERAGDAIEAVLLECWHDGLKDAVEAELRNMTNKTAQVPEAGATTK